MRFGLFGAGVACAANLFAGAGVIAGEPMAAGGPFKMYESRSPIAEGDGTLCELPEGVLRISLRDSVERAICFSPEAQQARAKWRDRVAQLEVSRFAYWPTVQATVQDGLERSVTSSDDPEFNSDTRAKAPEAQMSVSWTMFDFGLRGARVASARSSATSAYAVDEDAIQATVLSTVKDYLDLLKAISTADSDKEIERYSQELSVVAEGKYQGGTGLLTDKLQAESALADAMIKRITAEGDLNIAHGTLAVRIGLRADAQFGLTDDSSMDPTGLTSDRADELIEQALRNNPKFKSAYADLEAAEADLQAQRVTAYPTVALVMSSAFSRQSFLGENPEVGIFQDPSQNRSRINQVGFKVTIPISEAFVNKSRVSSAVAATETKASVLDSVKLQVTAEVWTAYQKRQASKDTREATGHALEIARELFSATRMRYEAGSGSLTDVLSAQSTLEAAQLKDVSARLDMRMASLSLLSSVGSLSWP